MPIGNMDVRFRVPAVALGARFLPLNRFSRLLTVGQSWPGNIHQLSGWSASLRGVLSESDIRCVIDWTP